MLNPMVKISDLQQMSVHVCGIGSSGVICTCMDQLGGMILKAVLLVLVDQRFDCLAVALKLGLYCCIGFAMRVEETCIDGFGPSGNDC